jgi:hypothetical protein
VVNLAKKQLENFINNGMEVNRMLQMAGDESEIACHFA